MKRRSSMKWRARDCWGLLLLVPLYMVFYLSTYLSEDCPTDHEDGKQWHTELYHRRWMEQWRPERFHSDPERWRSCLQELYPDFSSPFDYTERPVLLLAWHPLDNFLYIHQDSVRDCEVPCFLAADVSMEDDGCINEVDAFIFHPPTMHARRYNPAQKHPYQYWVVFTTEAEANYPILNDPTYRRMFDINMTYHLADDVPFTYFIDKNFYTDHWKLQPKTADVPVMMLISNCDPKSDRNQFVQELMTYINVDSYGQCFHNKDIPPEMKDWPWWEVKWNLTSRYKFTVAMENSISQDYVTEKLFHSFIVGTVPIYMGAPNVADFLPAPKSIINVADFPDVQSLAQYLHHLDKNEEAYWEYLQWKKDGPSQSFLELQNTSPRTALCRLCKEVARRQNRIAPTTHAHRTSPREP